MRIKRTERGWPGHYICSHRCQFRRNTLLEAGEVRVVISTVGRMLPGPIDNPKIQDDYEMIGLDRHFETMAFHAEEVEGGRYWDANVTRKVPFEAEWAITEVDADDKANDMHETVVKELSKRLRAGDKLEP